MSGHFWKPHSRNAFLDDTMLPEEFVQSITSRKKVMQSTVGPYHILRQIGHGGMGSVYMAEQRHPVRRMVAIKVIRQGLDSRDVVRRFHQEQRTLAMMDHPNIARVLDASITESGVSYFVMELVNGIPILAFCEEHPLDVEQRLRLFIDCCQAIQHAHQKGIIHRDIKPSNVMVTLQDGQPVVKVIDFGIAKAFATDNPEPMRSGNTFATQLGEFLGTPQYMSPEQAALDGVPLDTRTDIYSLGALLYAILTGGPPFDSTRLRQATFDEIRQIVREEDPLRPSVQVRVRAAAQDTAGNSGLSTTLRRLSQRLSGDLDCIVMKALEKDRERRYSTVNDLAEDIRSFLDNKPIHARAPTAIYTLRKLTQRHRSLVLGTVSAVLCLLVGATAALVQANRASIEANRATVAEAVANRERDAAVDARKIMAETLYASDLRLASAATIAKDAVTANDALQRHVPKPGETDPRSFDWHFLAAQNRIETRELLKSQKALYAMCRISGGTQIACCGMDGTIWILDELTGKLLHTIQADQGEVNGLASSPDGTILASAGDDGTIAFWDAATGAAKGRFPAHTRQAFQVAFSVDGQRMATCGNEPGVKIWTVSDHALLCEIPSGGRALECLAVSVHDDLAFGAEGGIVTLTKMPTTVGEVPQLRTMSDGSIEHCSAVAFSPDGRFLAAGRINGKVIVEAVDPALTDLREEFLLSDAVNSLSFSADGRSIGAGALDGAVSLLNLRIGDENGYRLTVHDSISDLAGNPLDGDGDGVAGGTWRSDSVSNSPFTMAEHPSDGETHQINPVMAESESNEALARQSHAHGLPILFRAEPAFVKGMLPRNTRIVTLEFSTPMANANDTRHYEFHLARNQNFAADDRLVIPDSANIDGAVVTLTLPESRTGSIPGNATHHHIQSWPLHTGSAACVLFSQNDDGVLSVGTDGRCRRVTTERRGAVELVASHAEDCEFGNNGRLLIRDHISQTGYLFPGRAAGHFVEHRHRRDAHTDDVETENRQTYRHGVFRCPRRDSRHDHSAVVSQSSGIRSCLDGQLGMSGRQCERSRQMNGFWRLKPRQFVTGSLQNSLP